MTRRAILTHGFASSIDRTWRDAGWPDLLEEVAVEPSFFALPGHVDSTLPPTTPVAEIEAALAAADPEADLALGFSAGALLTLRTAIARPGRFSALVLLGFGDGMWSPPGSRARAAERLRSGDDEESRLLRQMAASAGEELESLATFLAAMPQPPALEELRTLEAEVLLVLGERDTVGPADAVLDALPRARLVTLPGVDHNRTPSSPAAMDAVLDFLAERAR